MTRTHLSLIVASAIALAGGNACAEQVRLEARLAQPVLLAGTKQTVFLRVGLRGTPVASASERAPVNLSLVIDRSGSMAGDKIEYARRAALRVIDLLDRNDIISVVAYDSTVRVLLPATKVRDRESVRAAIRRLTPGNRTALFAGVSRGADEVRKFRSRNRLNRVILLSDGLANVGPSSPGELGALGRSLGRESITVTTLGLGLDYNEDLMAALARASDGNHAFIEDPRDLERIFRAEFGDILSVVAQDVRIDVHCAEGVRPVRVLGRDADIVGPHVMATLNQLYGGQEKFLLLELEVAPAAAGAWLELGRVEAAFGDTVARATETLTATVGASFTVSRAEVERRTDRDVTVSAVELLANEKSRAALNLRDEGRIGEAQKLLRENVDWLAENEKKYKAPSLRKLRDNNYEDALNLQPERWDRQRKKMRKAQHELDTQQSY